MFVAPDPATWDIENHSYGATTGCLDITCNQVMDYRINRDHVTVVVAMDNSVAAMPPLWTNAYHVISVGSATGQHSRGGTNLEGAGRMKPDIVGTATWTSYCTPIVASAAGVLIAETKRTAPLAAAKDPRTIKALLMAGATKEQFPTWSQTPARPLDPIYGAGQVNIANSYRTLIAGQQRAGTAWRPVNGWDLGTSGTSAVYYFEVPAGQTLKFSTVLTWHRELPDNGYYINFISTLTDLNLRLRYSNASFALGTIVAQSASALDNVEHIYIPALPAGRYALEVSGPAGTTYGIAWNGRSASPAVVAQAVAAPAITSQPAASSVIEGQTASFTVTACGSSLTYQWYKNRIVIPSATSATYTIAATIAANAGIYSVTVSNPAGSVSSNSVTLAVATRPIVPPPTSLPAPAPASLISPSAWQARGQNGTAEGIANLFDNNTATKWLDFSGATWVRVTFAAPIVLSSYSLTSANDSPERDPASWTLSGSNDGNTWIPIESRSTQSFTARFQRRDFTLAQPTAAYLQYRIDLSATAGAITQLAELQFYSTSILAAAPGELLPISIIARGDNAPLEGVANLLDHSTTTKWLDFSGATWVQVAFANPRVVNAYSLVSANDYPVRDPVSWTLSGSNDGITWTVIEKRTGQSFASRLMLRDFVLSQPSAPYLMFRIDMAAQNGAITQLSGIEFWGP